MKTDDSARKGTIRAGQAIQNRRIHEGCAGQTARELSAQKPLNNRNILKTSRGSFRGQKKRTERASQE
jgi:hypothetical protein